MVSASILLTFLGNDQCWGLGGDTLPTLKRATWRPLHCALVMLMSLTALPEVQLQFHPYWEWGSDSQTSSSGLECVGK